MSYLGATVARSNAPPLSLVPNPISAWTGNPFTVAWRPPVAAIPKPTFGLPKPPVYVPPVFKPKPKPPFMPTVVPIVAQPTAPAVSPIVQMITGGGGGAMPTGPQIAEESAGMSQALTSSPLPLIALAVAALFLFNRKGR